MPMSEMSLPSGVQRACVVVEAVDVAQHRAPQIAEPLQKQLAFVGRTGRKVQRVVGHRRLVIVHRRDLGPDVGLRAVDVGEAVLVREFAGRDGLLVPSGSLRVGGQGGDGSSDVAGRLGGRELGRRDRQAAFGSRRIDRVAPVVLVDLERFEHHLRAQEAGRDGDGGPAMRFEFVALRERQPVHRHLGEVVEHRDPVVATRCSRWCRP